MPHAETDQPDLAWCKINGQLIFLDLKQDRYFRLPDKRNAELVTKLEACSQQDWQQPTGLPLPRDWQPPLRASSAITTGNFRLGHVAKALWTQRRVETRIAARSFAEVLATLRTLVERRTSFSAKPSEAGRACIRAFEQARLIRTAADRCLARSIALSTCLASHGDRARVVLGVRSPPFGAHCWVQHGDTVLNDSLEEVLRFHPILVV